MREEIKQIPGLQGYYASNLEYIYQKDPDYPEDLNMIGTYPMMGQDTPYVYIDGKHYTIGNLVARTFIFNDVGENAVVFHIDGNPKNNQVDNLIWVTPGERKRLTTKSNAGEIFRVYLNELRRNDENQ